jgi:hypothetical protein
MTFLFTEFASAQTLDEWFKQKKTQRKYLMLQIAKLQLHIEKVRQGYKIIKDGLNLVGQIKDGDFKIHHLFISDLSRVKKEIRQSPKFKATYALYLQNLQSCSILNHDLLSFSFLTAQYKELIQKCLHAISLEMENDMRSIQDISSNAVVDMTDDERFKRIDIVYNRLINQKGILQSAKRNISLLNSQRSKSYRAYEHLLENNNN